MSYNYDADTERMFEIINENNRRAHEQMEKERIQEEEYRRVQEKREKFKTRAKNILFCAVLSAGLVTGAKYGIEAINREVDLNRANNYMNTYINYVCPEYERGILKDGTVVVSNSDGKLYFSICKELMKKYGMSRDCAIYCISKKYGDEAFDDVVREYGYSDKDNFLYELYPIATSISSSGETVYSKEGSFKSFENNVQVELVNKVREIQEYFNNIKNEEMGLKK